MHTIYVCEYDYNLVPLLEGHNQKQANTSSIDQDTVLCNQVNIVEMMNIESLICLFLVYNIWVQIYLPNI